MNTAALLRQAAKMAGRDWRGGELRLLAAALTIAVAAITSVGFFVDRIQSGLERDAAQLLGGDVSIGADAPIDPALRERAGAAGLAVAETIAFPSMAISATQPDRSVLAAIKAVSPAYPLRGALTVAASATSGAAAEESVHAGPAAGTAWVDPQILSALGLAIGDELQLGDARLRVARSIVVEPDRGAQFANFAPRVMIAMADLPATGLMQEGSRATYRLLAAGPPGAVRTFVASTRGHLGRGQQLETIESGRPDMQRTLDRARHFLAVVALLAALIAAVAVATAARRFGQRHLDACALMRSLGVVQRDLVRLFVAEFAWVGCAACAAGTAAGLLLHLVLMQALGALLQTSLPAPSAWPAVQGVACGLVLLFGFALPPLLRLGRVPPMRVLRRDLGPPAAATGAGYLVGLGGFAALLLWSAGDLRIGAMIAGGFAGGVCVFTLLAFGMLRLATLLRHAAGGGGVLSWRFAIAAMSRRPAATIVQMVSLAVGIMALLLLVIVRTDLVGAWRRQVPPDAPNRFVINIQPDQEAAVARRLAEGGVAGVELYPMVRGRLIERNGAPIGPGDYTDERARRLVDREFNLSYATTAAPQSPVVAGRFGADGDELSIESGIATTLGIHLGDRLTFDIAGERVTAVTSSIRKVQWDSLKVNFFVVMPPKLLADKPHTFITAFHLEPGQLAVGASLVQEFPNLTVIDTSVILRQVQGVLDQVILAVEFLFSFTLAAGLLVLYAALSGSHDERVREAALLRALGARSAQLARAHGVELVAVGASAGLLAAIGATAVGWMLARYAFDFDYTPPLWALGAGVAAGIACAGAAGTLDLRRVLRTPAMTSLRDAS